MSPRTLSLIALIGVTAAALPSAHAQLILPAPPAEAKTPAETPLPAAAKTARDQAEADTEAKTARDQAATDAAPNRNPWRLARAVNSPDWLYFEAHHRTRYEHIINQFRAGREGDGGLLSMRTGIFGELRLDRFRLGVEMIDSRAYLSNDVVPLNTGLVNAIELLRGYVGLEFRDIGAPGNTLTMRAGRLTMDVGSRRLMARNRFRNTINAFTGLEARYKAKSGLAVTAFAVMPIERRPRAADDLSKNRIEFDQESFDVLHGGALVASPKISRFDLRFEGYAYGLYERDSEERSTKNRRLVTSGFRIYRKPAKGELDFEVESALQVGVSRASSDSGDVTDLDHLALFQHAEVGFSPAVIGHPRFVLQYDFASGDDDPNDDRQGRFDTLYGARRFEFGPTGIYGAFARSNIRSPGFRMQLKPSALGRGFIGYRAIWLDEAADGWTTSGLRAGPNSNATFIGHQLEARVRIEPIPGNLRIEPGVAHLFPADFIDNSEQANEITDTTMVYLQVAGKL